MARVKGENKQERLAREIGKAVGAGVPWHLETVDFSDPNRPKTCLEIDFPILPLNSLSKVEGSSGSTRKPIYQMSKWWARRNSSVFRAMLLAASTKSPDDPTKAASLIWEAYYGNHQSNTQFSQLHVADIFMGGGTTVVEGSRLGMQMTGNDLNPVAWFIVKNELANPDPREVHDLFSLIKNEVRHQILPFSACECPQGHKGRWINQRSDKVMQENFDPLQIPPDERKDYSYVGPEVMYTFWAKHGPCVAAGCGHRTPIFTTPIVAARTLTVRAWKDVECASCGRLFDIEEAEARLAPSSLFTVSPDEPPYALKDNNGNAMCPTCGAMTTGIISGKAYRKPIQLSLLIHPDWLKGRARAHFYDDLVNFAGLRPPGSVGIPALVS